MRQLIPWYIIYLHYYEGGDSGRQDSEEVVPTWIRCICMEFNS